MPVLEQNLQKLSQLLNALEQNPLTKEEFINSFEAVVKLIKALETRLETKHSQAIAQMEMALDQMKNNQMVDTAEMKKEMMGMMMPMMASMQKDHKKMMAAMDKKMAEMKDGKDADEIKIVQDVLAQIKLPEHKETVLDNPKQLRDKLETLKDEERLDKSAIKGIEQLEADLKSAKSVRIAGGPRGISLYTGSTKRITMAQTLNLVAGTGMAIAYSYANGLNTLTFTSSGGSGFTKLTATGTVNGSNAAFTFIQLPSYIVSDGVWLEQTDNNSVVLWTWVAGTLTATLKIPPQSSIYGIA